MSSRDWSTARSFGRFMQALHLLQPATQSTLSTDDILFILDVNEIQADGQPKQVSISELGSSIPISAAGLDTQVQFNDGGARAGDSGLTFNKTTNALTAGSFIPTSSTIPSNGLYSPNTNQVALSTNGTGRLFVDASGSVGIGTTSPGVALDVNGDARADGLYGYSDTNTGIEFPGSDVIVFKEGGAEAARIDSNGRLLVGTSTGNAPLTVAGTNVEVRNSNGAYINNSETTSVSTSATTIIADAGFQGRLWVINGAEGSNRFCDLVMASTAAAPVVVQSYTSFGTPTARTYTRIGSAVQLAMASGTYGVRCIGFGA